MTTFFNNFLKNLSHNLTHNLQAFNLLTGLKLKKTLSFKANLYTQIIGMILNNLMYFSVWFLLIARFGNINGYGIFELILVQGFMSIFYAIYFWFFGGMNKLSTYLNQDQFLDLQLYPISPLTVLVTRGGSASNFGDFVQGAVFVVAYFVNLFMQNSNTFSSQVFIQILLILPALLIGIAGFFGASLLVNSLIFFAPKLLNLPDFLDQFYIGAGLYPSQNFQGWFKYILYTLGIFSFIFTPIEVVRGFFRPEFLILSAVLAVAVNLLGFYVWGLGIKKVENGSSTGAVE